MRHLTQWFRARQRRGANPAIALALALSGLLPGAALHAANPRVVLTPAPSFSITWDGNNGAFFGPGATAGPSNNVALASNGTVAFGSTELDFGVHYIRNVNDGIYGNSHSWIANFTQPDPDPFVGLRFTSSVTVSNIAWGRDNGDTVETACGGTCMDRSVGTYTLQYTTVAAPNATTGQTDDAATGWETIGTVQFLGGADTADFAAYLRHEFRVARNGAAIAATGVRIKVSDPAIAIDEIEVNPPRAGVAPITDYIELAPATGFSIAWDRNEGFYSTTNSPAPAPVNAASASMGARGFASSELNFGVHFATNVNDGLYGNAHSWIADFSANPDPAPFIGVRFGRRLLLRNLAWGRDNGDVAGDCCGGTLKDRALGVYILQVTTVTNPGAATPEACGLNSEEGWVTIGTVNYKADNAAVFNAYLRHRFDLAQNGLPIPATAIRIKVPNNNIAIDEIEVNSNLAVEQNAVRITNGPGYTLSWDGNDGHFENPAVGAAPPPNRALASQGTTPFASSDLGPVLDIPFHRIVNLNDGLYGNSHSWISANGVGGNSDPDPFAGLNFGGSVTITNIAWSRDNGDVPGDCCGGTATDRALDTYRLQFTQVTAPNATTPDTGDSSTGWQDLGTIVYVKASAPFFNPHLRHRFDIAGLGGPLVATGIRIKVNGNTALDEIEINTGVAAPTASSPVDVRPAPGYGITWDGNDGYYFDAAPAARPPANRALASQGTTAFTSSDLGPVLNIPIHRAVNLNDGRYGNANSWISANGIGGTSDPDPFFGLNFGGLINLTNVSWSRDNGDNDELVATDRSLGNYVIQVTTVAAPDASTPDTGDSATGWSTVGTVNYRRAELPDFSPHLRHRFDLSAAGAPIEATGLRVKVSGTTAIDEVEVNTPGTRPLPAIRLIPAGAVTRVYWSGGGSLESADTVNGPWTCLGDAVSPFSMPKTNGTMRFFRVRR